MADRNLISDDAETAAPSVRGSMLTLQLIFISLVSGPVMLLIIALATRQAGFSGFDHIWGVIAAAVLVNNTALGWGMFLFICRRCQAEDDAARLATYQQASLVRWACLEGAALLAFVGLLVAGSPVAMACGIVALLLMAPTAPTTRRYAAAMGLTREQRDALLPRMSRRKHG